MKKRTLILFLSVVGIVLIGGGIAAYVALRPSSQPPGSSQPVTTPPPVSKEPEATTQPTPVIVKVYFSKHPESDDDPSKVFYVSRLSPDLGVATYAVEQMLIGPSAPETADGYFTTVRVRDDQSICNDRDFKITINDTVATLQFCRTFDAVGSVSDGQAQETINATLLQFPTITKVIILGKDGNCQFDMSGENRCLW